MFVTKRKARIERICFKCEEPIPVGELYVNTTVQKPHSDASKPFFLIHGFHISCFIVWFLLYERKRTRISKRKISIRKSRELIGARPRGRPILRDDKKTTVLLDEKGNQMTDKNGYAIPIFSPITPEQKKRRAVLTTLYHRHKASRDVGYILEEMESLGGIPKKWLE